MNDLALHENQFLEWFKTLGYKYITRGKTGFLYVFKEVPTKNMDDWCLDLGKNGGIGSYSKILLKFIKFEDDKLYLIDDLLRDKEK